MLSLARLGAAVAGGLMLIATVVSNLSHTARLPLWLVDSGGRQLSTLQSYGGIPLEFIGCVWFLVVACLLTSTRLSQYPSLVWFVRITAPVLVGGGVGLCYRAGAAPVPVVASLLIAASLWGVGLSLDIPAPMTVKGSLTQIRLDYSRARHVPGSAAAGIAALGLIGMAGQYLALSARNTTSSHFDAQFTQWYLSRPQLGSDILKAPGVVRTVVFSDYECQFCSAVVPEFERVARRFRESGYRRIEFVLKDFPLNSDCNPAVTGRLHPVACDAAVASRVVKRVLGEEEARRFRMKLYQQRGKLSADYLRSLLMSVNALAEYQKMYSEEVIAVKNDAVDGERLGITGTPTTFVDGRLVRNLSPHGLETLLDYHAGKAGKSTELSFLNRLPIRGGSDE